MRDGHHRGRCRRALAGALLALAVAGPAVVAAREAAPAAADPALEAKMATITSELRCLVCQNQTIAESDAGLAVDLRRETRAMLQAGKSKDEILGYMTARYGDFVLYRPPVKATTAVLWFGPAVLLVAGVATLALVLRRRQRLGDDAFEPDPDAAADGTDAASPDRPSRAGTAA